MISVMTRSSQATDGNGTVESFASTSKVTLESLQAAGHGSSPGSPRYGKGTFHCTWPGCLRSFSRKLKLDEHIRTHTDERPYKCDRCDSAFKRKEHLKAHAERVHAQDAANSDGTPGFEERAEGLASPRADSSKKFVCQYLIPKVLLLDPSDGEDSRKEVISAPCGKRFWTNQHLQRHIEDVHEDEDTVERRSQQSREISVVAEGMPKQYKCREPGCQESFAKRKRLREHVWERHSLLPEKAFGSSVSTSLLTTGSAGGDVRPAEVVQKPFPCSHPGCDKTFLTNAKRAQHAKVHEEGRYTCALPHSDNSEELRAFPTWSALQKHMRDDHPPTCPHPECKGMVFKTGARLNKHLKKHQDDEEKQKLAEAKARKAGSSEEGGGVLDGPLDESLMGELRACPWPGCTKKLMTSKAIKSHYNITHLGIKKFICGTTDVGQGSAADTSNEGPALDNTVGCGRAFGHKHELVRHLRICEVRKMESVLRTIEQAEQSSGKGKGKERMSNLVEGSENAGGDVAQDQSIDLDDDAFREEGGAVPQDHSDRPTAPSRQTNEPSTSTSGRLRELLKLDSAALTRKRKSLSEDNLLDEWQHLLPPPPEKKRRKMRGALLGCPWQRIQMLANAEAASSDDNNAGASHSRTPDPTESTDASEYACTSRFSRVYDLSRHLKSAHGLELSAKEILAIVPQEERDSLPPSRSNAKLST